MDSRHDTDNASVRTITGPPPAYSTIVSDHNPHWSELGNGARPARTQSPTPTYRTVDIDSSDLPDKREGEKKVNEKPLTKHPELEKETKQIHPRHTRDKKQQPTSKRRGFWGFLKPTADDESPFPGWTAIHTHAKRGEITEIQRLLTTGKHDINESTEEGWTPLLITIQFRRANTQQPAEVKALLTLGADPSLAALKGWNALHVASQQGLDEVVSTILNSSRKMMDIHATTPDGRTAIELAAQAGYPKTVAVLLDFGATSDHPDHHADRGRRTALHHAAQGGHSDVVLLLLARPGTDESARDDQGWTAADCAVAADNADVVRVFLERRSPMAVTESDGGYLLHYAVRRGLHAVVKMLLQMEEYQAQVNTRTEQDGVPPLFLAIEHGFYRLVTVLLAHGADMNMTIGEGMTPLIYAVQYKMTRVVSVLLYHDPGQRDVGSESGDNAVHWAAGMGCLEIASLLIGTDMGPRIDLRNNKGQTPLHVACAKNCLQVVDFLMRRSADVKAQDIDGFTPFMFAANNGHLAVMKRILALETNMEHLIPIPGKLEPLYEEKLIPFLCGKDSWLNEKINGSTLLHSAARAGHKEIVEMLLKNNARSFFDRNRQMPADLARSNQHEDVLALLDPGSQVSLQAMIARIVREGDKPALKAVLDGALESEKNLAGSIAITEAAIGGRGDWIDWLLGLGYDINWMGTENKFGKFGFTPLYMMALRGSAGGMQLLLDRGADPHHRTPSGYTPLMQAAESGYLEVIHLLVRSGVDVSETNNNSESALHIAARRGRKEAVTVLLEEGIKVHARDNRGQTALDAAIDEGQKEIIAVISDFLPSRDKKH